MTNSRDNCPNAKDENSSAKKPASAKPPKKPKVTFANTHQMETVHIFEIFAATLKGVTDREKIWALETFTELSLGFAGQIAEMCTGPDDPEALGAAYRMKQLEMGMDVLKQVAKKLVPGFKGKVVVEWREAVAKRLKELEAEYVHA